MTKQTPNPAIFVAEMENEVLNELNILAFTHHTCNLDQIGLLHLNDETREETLAKIKQKFGLTEVMYLATCNRVELVMVSPSGLPNNSVEELISELRPDHSREVLNTLKDCGKLFHGMDAARHFLMVAASLDSLVIGEREIITQVRSSFESNREAGLTGDVIRLLVKKAIEAAKEVYTGTQIAHKPVSVVSLAYRKLRELNVDVDSRILIIGAGQTNVAMSRYLKKHGFRKFTVFNRTFSKGEILAGELDGKAYPLTELTDYTGGFDVIITCTGSGTEIITPEIYRKLLMNETSRKIVIDLAIPYDFNRGICDEFPVHMIEITSLRNVADENMRQRQGELEECHNILDKHLLELEGLFRQRSVELAMKEVPFKIREIKDRAMNGVFAKEIETLDDQSREVLEKVIGYMEKKYISVPMKMAREILIGARDK